MTALIQGYSSSSEDESEGMHLSNAVVNYKPEVHLDEELVPYNALDNDKDKNKKTLSGYIQHEVYDKENFEIQKRTFDMLGYSQGVSGGIEGDSQTALELGNIDITQYKVLRRETKNIKRQRSDKGDAAITSGKKMYKGPWAKYEGSSGTSDTGFEDADEDEEEEEEETITTKSKQKDVVYETTEFFGRDEFDYQGRSYMHVPRDLDINLYKEPGEQECFVPKRCIHRWEGHIGGTNKIQFFPKHGHLLLSCGNDNRILLYDAHHDRELLRGFFGHSKLVKDITFNNCGDKFLSCSYDKYIKQWDTETGKCITKIKVSALPNVVKYNPNESLQDEFLVGLTNKKIEQYDLRSNEIIQTYDHHLGAINSITFIDDDKKFISSSDDKSLRIWNYQINVPIKLIADPSQYSMPCIALHPQRKYVAAQSMNNTIEVISAQGNKFKRNKKKLFNGHNCAGYGIGLNFSPDGKILMSGDNNGYGFFWDWKTCKLVTKLKIDDKLISCIEQNPQEVSKVAMSGLSGKIYYYE